jgi:hypothetical protein
VVSSIVEARTAEPRASPIWYAASAVAVITAPCTHSRTQFAADSTGAPSGRGGCRIRPGVAASHPRATAIGTSMIMFSHRICSGFSGWPAAMLSAPASTNTAM